LKFSQNKPKKILFSLRLKKGQEKAKRPNHFISGKLFQKRPNKADLAFLKAKWQPCAVPAATGTHEKSVVHSLKTSLPAF
jgi:hypothetical protein